MLHVMAGMHCGRARGQLRLHCVVAQGPASSAISVLLEMVATLVGVLFSWWRLVALRHVACHSRLCTLPAGRLLHLSLMAQSMLLYDLPGVAWQRSWVSIFVY